MPTLVYKRTHLGDPDSFGRFGCRDCMGRVRSWKFDSVIGIGGLSAEPRSFGIDGKVTWIGIGPHWTPSRRRGPVVTFDHFLLLGTVGAPYIDVPELIAERMRGVRALMRFTEDEQAEIDQLLNRARYSHASLARPVRTSAVMRSSRLRCRRICR